MSKEGIPLAHEVFPGNTNDLSCFKEIITQLSRKYPIGKILLVGDRGMICQKNLDFLHEKKLEYILGYRMRTIPKRDRALVLSKADLLKVRDDLSFKEVIYNNQRLLVCYNPEHAILDAQKKEDILDRIRKRIKGRSINTKLSSGTIIETYKGLWQVEHAFRNLKTELEMGPVYHWK
jgi:transposase